MLAEKLPVNGLRVIEILVALLLVGKVAAILVIRILRNDYYVFLKFFRNGAYDCGFARARTAGYTDYEHILEY